MTCVALYSSLRLRSQYEYKPRYMPVPGVSTHIWHLYDINQAAVPMSYPENLIVISVYCSLAIPFLFYWLQLVQGDVVDEQG